MNIRCPRCSACAATHFFHTICAFFGFLRLIRFFHTFYTFLGLWVIYLTLNMHLNKVFSHFFHNLWNFFIWKSSKAKIKKLVASIRWIISLLYGLLKNHGLITCFYKAKNARPWWIWPFGSKIWRWVSTYPHLVIPCYHT